VPDGTLASVRRIVVAYDDPASVTLEHAAELAESVGAELIITNVTAAIDVEDTAEAAGRGQAKLEEARRRPRQPTDLNARGRIRAVAVCCGPRSGSSSGALLRGSAAFERSAEKLVTTHKGPQQERGGNGQQQPDPAGVDG
jgi:nucleotide-binding universal stress UspA family protein